MSSAELGPGPALHLPDPLLQESAQHGIGSGDRNVEVTGRQDDRGDLLVEAHGRPEMAPERLEIRGRGSGQEDLGGIPFGAAQGAQGVDRNGDRPIRDLIGALDLGLVDRIAEQGRVAPDRRAPGRRRGSGC